MPLDQEFSEMLQILTIFKQTMFKQILNIQMLYSEYYKNKLNSI